MCILTEESNMGLKVWWIHRHWLDGGSASFDAWISDEVELGKEGVACDI